ncbi:diacylglycerol kinase family protein [Staphylococcus durrellii]|uniref:diacylglycerol kinase family protein n=1 Tax=Staphylococcus durrellii TaxID=2781773 RepID=UPI00189DD51D|nr:diacylglycerol kinase family protein [Staphylococcus durrellii]MBF7016995.1 diacylglycerol kinase family protein [Staphylococcus durrellii]
MGRFKHAFAGLFTLLKKDHNFFVHIICAVLVIILGLALQLTPIEWVIIIIAIGLVLICEAINTAIEFIVDLVTESYATYAKYAKDIGAFSVLIASVVALLLGLIIFIPHFIHLLQ